MECDRKKILSKNIGNKIYELRKANKLSREKFAEICNLSSQHIYYMEKGEFLPGCLTIIDICNNFHITPTELLIDNLDIDLNIFEESIKKDFSKLSNENKRFLQCLIQSTITLLLDKKDN